MSILYTHQNSITPFRWLSEKFVSQYMCSVWWKQSVTSLFHIHMGKSEPIRDCMKRFGVMLLQLDSMSSDTVLQAVKQAIHWNTQFFDSLSLQPPASIDELLQGGNHYAMLKDNVVAATNQTVANTSGSHGSSGAKERGREANRVETPSSNVTMES